MEEFFDLPTIIVIGIAIFVLVRLRGGPGHPHRQRARPAPAGEDRDAGDRRHRGAAPPACGSAAEPVQNADAERQQRRLATEIEQFSHGDAAVAAGLKAINEADPAFAPKSFIEGAKAAYEMIVTAFAQGDRKTLKNLLEKDVYDGFERAIDDREAAGNKVDFTFVGLPKVEITEAEVDKRQAPGHGAVQCRGRLGDPRQGRRRCSRATPTRCSRSPTSGPLRAIRNRAIPTGSSSPPTR